MTGEVVSKSKELHLSQAESLSLQVPPHVCANTNLIALSSDCSGLSDTPRLAEAVFAASTGTTGISEFPCDMASEITKVRRLLSLSAELSSALLALSPLFPPSGRLSAELLSSFLAFSPFSPTTIRTTTTSLRFGVFSVCQPSYRLLFSLSLPSSLLLVVCLPSYRLLFSFSPLSLHDDKDHDDIT